MEFQKLTEDIVITLHDEILKASPGLPGISQNKSIEGALARIEQHHYYNNIDDIFEIAALYLIAISQGHLFIDGNKRTALGCCYIFFYLNGYELQQNSSEGISTFVEGIAQKIFTTEQIIAYLKLHAIKIES